MHNDQLRRLWPATAAVCLVLCLVAAYPISTSYTRALSIALGAALCLLLGILSWRVRLARALLAVAGIAVVALLLGPGRNISSPSLAKAYASELLRYRGTRYVWGGENRLGIDCSGLVRSALSNAAILRGVTTAIHRSSVSAYHSGGMTELQENWARGTVAKPIQSRSQQASMPPTSRSFRLVTLRSPFQASTCLPTLATALGSRPTQRLMRSSRFEYQSR